jgi:ectoine hydroxylase-related dioxygenase (phytanoyl-CoA dioxygenase family)
MSPDELRAAFDRQGYAIAQGVFGADVLAGLSDDFDRIVRQLRASGEDVNARWGGPGMERLRSAGTEVVHTHNVQRYSSRWADALRHPAFLDLAEALLGPDIVLHHTKLFEKPPGRGAPFPLHQDWTYFPTRLDSMLAAVIHVSASRDEMGCLRVVPGSHRLGRVEGTSGQGPSEVLERHALEDAVPVEAEPGDVLFFHCFTLHGSCKNVSETARRTVLVQMYAGEDEVEAGNEHPDAGLVLRGFNPRMTREGADR